MDPVNIPAKFEVISQPRSELASHGNEMKNFTQ